MVYTSDLVADKVTAGLKAKLLENVWRKPTEFGYSIYVSAQGDDTTGNGTQGKPFKTVSRAITWLVDNYIGRPNTNYTVHALTDIDETQAAYNIQFHPWHLKISADGHNVRLGRFYIQYSIVSFEGVTFCQSSAHRCVESVRTRVQLVDCFYENLLTEGNHSFSPFHFSRGSYATVRNLTGKNTYNGPSFFISALNSLLDISGNCTLTAETVTQGGGFLFAMEQSEISVGNRPTAVVWPGKKYVLDANSVIWTARAGEDYLPGDLPGTINDEHSQVL